MMLADWEKDAMVIGRRLGYRRYAEVMGAAWLAAREAEASWRPDGGASRRTFFARRLTVELLCELPRRSVPLARLCALAENDDGVMVAEAEIEPERDMAMACARLALLPAPERRVAAEILRGATVREVANANGISPRRAQQLAASAVELLVGRPGGAQGDFFGGVA